MEKELAGGKGNPFLGSLMERGLSEAIRDRVWRQVGDETAFNRAGRSLLTVAERKLLYWLGWRWYAGEGALIDLGSFLGSSTVALAAGLERGEKAGTIHAYDLFEVSRDKETQRFLGKEEGDSFLEDFKETTRGHEERIRVYPGDIRKHPWKGGAVSLLFVDLAKSWEMNQYIIREFYKHLVPGESLLIHQDFGNGWNPWLPVSMAYLNDYFEILADETPSRIYRCRKAIPEAVLSINYKRDLDKATRLSLMEESLAGATGPMRKKLHAAMAILLFIEEGKEAGMAYVDAWLPRLDLQDYERSLLERVRETIDIWNQGESYEREMATKF